MVVKEAETYRRKINFDGGSIMSMVKMLEHNVMVEVPSRPPAGFVMFVMKFVRSSK